jgi:hypothetical protein
VQRAALTPFGKDELRAAAGLQPSRRRSLKVLKKSVLASTGAIDINKV